jgi:hypothetical protein
MVELTDYNSQNIKDEILNKLRYGLNSYDTQDRVDEITTLFSGNDVETEFELDSNIMNYVKSVTVDSVALTFGTEWNIYWRGSDRGKIILTTAPASGTNNISVVWGKSNAKKGFVYPDFPRADLSNDNYPRIGFKLNSNVSIAGLSGQKLPLNYEILLQVKIVALNSYDIETISQGVHDFILQNCKNFYNFSFIQPETIQELDNLSDNTGKSLFKILNFKIPTKISLITYA